VIIPTYNRASLVTSAIKSVINQTYQDYEIIVIDDGSTDNTLDVLAAYSDQIKYVLLPHSGNPATARNAGLSIAEGEYVAFLDSDDEWLPEKLERQVQILNSNPEIGLICSNALVRYHGREQMDQLYLHPDWGFSGSVLPELLERNFIITSTTIIRRAILEKTGAFCQLPALTAEDYDLWLRIASLSNIHFIPDALAIYTEYSGSNLRFTRKVSQHWQGHLIILDRLRKFAEKQNLQLDIPPKAFPELAFHYQKNLIKALWNEREFVLAISLLLKILFSHPTQVFRWLLFSRAKLDQSTRKLLVGLSSNALLQRLLEHNVTLSQYLMGIGSGGTPDTSGEKVLIDKLRQEPSTGSPLCIFDIGANKGQFLKFIEHGLQDVSIHIHAFEPSQYAYKILCDCAKVYSNVTLNNLGLGKQPGKFELFYNEAGSGLASLTKRRLEHFGVDFKYSEIVDIDTLDNYCHRKSIQKIDLLKIDVEGHELDVLLGGKQMFNNRKIRMVSFEFGGCNIDSRTYLQDFYYFFRANGMNRMYRITPSGYLYQIRNYQEIIEQFQTTNFLVLQGE